MLLVFGVAAGRAVVAFLVVVALAVAGFVVAGLEVAGLEVAGLAVDAGRLLRVVRVVGTGALAEGALDASAGRLAGGRRETVIGRGS